MLTVGEVLKQIEYSDGIVKSKTTGKTYEVDEFIDRIAEFEHWGAKKKDKLKSAITGKLVRSQSDNSKYVEFIMNKYELEFSDGVYLTSGNVISQDDLYRLLWSNEKLLPTEANIVLENIELISQQKDLQGKIFETIKEKAETSIPVRSKYLDSLYKIYPDIPWVSLLHNILVPNTKPMFHIFYDDGVGGTGKSTLLEVLTMIVGSSNVSNVLLDQFSNRFIFANMLGKYINAGDDNGKNDELANVGTLKSIVTGNRVTIDRKNMQPIEVRIFAKQLFATNIMPYIDFTDGGLMRRLNIVPMNKVIPKTEKLPEFTRDELGSIIREAIAAPDLSVNRNELAITTSPLYRFYKSTKVRTYSQYKDFCLNNGFRVMNIINFETKMKFIENHCDKQLTEITEKGEMPF